MKRKIKWKPITFKLIFSVIKMNYVIRKLKVLLCIRPLVDHISSLNTIQSKNKLKETS